MFEQKPLNEPRLCAAIRNIDRFFHVEMTLDCLEPTVKLILEQQRPRKRCAVAQEEAAAPSRCLTEAV